MIETLAMHGYGSYIWSAYGISAFLIFALLYRSFKQWRTAKKSLLEKSF